MDRRLHVRPSPAVLSGPAFPGLRCGESASASGAAPAKWPRMWCAKARGCIFFHSHEGGAYVSLSQFGHFVFVDEDGTRYCCAEQFMMACKARVVMGDESTLAAILACGHDPKAIKGLGRLVRPSSRSGGTQ